MFLDGALNTGQKIDSLISCEKVNKGRSRARCVDLARLFSNLGLQSKHSGNGLGRFSSRESAGRVAGKAHFDLICASKHQRSLSLNVFEARRACCVYKRFKLYIHSIFYPEKYIFTCRCQQSNQD